MRDINIDIEDKDIYHQYELGESLNYKQFSLRDAGITSRVHHNWRRAGLIPDAEEDGKWVYFDFFQYLWLQLIKDLRDFGLPLEIIATVKGTLFAQAENPTEMLDEATKVFLKNDLISRHGHLAPEIPELIEANFKVEDIHVLPPFYGLVFNHLYHRSLSTIYIYQDGSIEVWSDYLAKVYPEQKPALDRPYLAIPLAPYMKEFLSDETKARFLPTLPLISPEEIEVLQAMRSNNVKELAVKFTENGKAKRIDLITKRDGEISADKIAQFTKLLATKKNMSFTMKTKVGPNLYYEIEERKNIK